jgi:hypothetical protein
VSSLDTSKGGDVKLHVDTSNPVEHAYSLTSSPALPTTNIFVPSVLNARPRGDVSSLDTSKGGDVKVVSANTSLIGIIKLDKSKTDVITKTDFLLFTFVDKSSL